jgi:hypothetical protein
MTINERLFVSGLMADYDSAVNARDEQRAADILASLEISPEQARATVLAIFANPEKYGYSPDAGH